MAISWRFSDWPLRAKLAALLVVASLSPLAIWAYVDLRQDQARLLDGVKSLLEARGDQIVRELDSFHHSYRRSADRLARFPDSAAYCTEAPEQPRKTVRVDGGHSRGRSLPATTGSAELLLIDAFRTSRDRVGVATRRGSDLSHRPNVQMALPRGNSVITDLFISSPASPDPCRRSATSHPCVRRPTRRVVCVAVPSGCASASLWRTVKASNGLAGAGSFAVLFDREGIRVGAHLQRRYRVPSGRPAGCCDDRQAGLRAPLRRRTRAFLEDVRPFPEQFERARAGLPDLSVFRRLRPGQPRPGTTASRAASRRCPGRCSTWCR